MGEDRLRQPQLVGTPTQDCPPISTERRRREHQLNRSDVIADKGADASIAMHENFGFTEVGRMGKVGFKFGRWLGTVLMQKSLK